MNPAMHPWSGSEMFAAPHYDGNMCSGVVGVQALVGRNGVIAELRRMGMAAYAGVGYGRRWVDGSRGFGAILSFHLS